MKIKFFLKFIILSALVNSCQTSSTPASQEKLRSELFAVEKEFCAMAQSEGVQKAFVYFCDDSVVIIRRGQLLKGKEAMRKEYASFPANAKIDWAPDFADVSSSGDLGYTYGKYMHTYTDSIGHTTQTGGIFHTVWKRQPDGKWRFVWD